MNVDAPSSRHKVSLLDVNAVIVDLYESKLLKVVKKLPRSHLLVLRALASVVEKNPTEVVKESALLLACN